MIVGWLDGDFTGKGHKKLGERKWKDYVEENRKMLEDAWEKRSK